MSDSHVTTHILDTTTGRPAVGVSVVLEALHDETWSRMATGLTDADGRVKVLGPSSLQSGVYRLRFDTGSYFAGISQDTFFPEVSLTFSVPLTICAELTRCSPGTLVANAGTRRE